MHVIGSREEGGAERLYLRLTAALAGAGEDVLCVLRPSSVLARRLAPGLRRELLRMRSIFDPFARSRLRAVARGFGAQVVQTYMGRATRLAQFDPRRSPGIVHVARVGGYDDVKAMRHAHGWLASTDGIRHHLIESGLPEDRVFHVPHLLADPTPPLDAARRAASRAALGLEPDCALVLCLGRLHRERGVDLMVEALARLPDTVDGRALRLLVVGDGPQREPLEAQAAGLGLGAKVCFVSGEAAPQPWLQLADLLVYPSRHSAVATAILEAWNHRVPVVATRTAASTELMGDGEHGALVEAEDVAGLADAVLMSLERSEDERRAIVERTHALITARHTAGPVVARCLDAYVRLTA